MTGAADRSVMCASLSDPGAKEGREGERAAGEVFDRCRGERRSSVEPSLTVSRDGVLGNREKAGLLVGCGEVDRRGLSCLAFSSNSRSCHPALEIIVGRSSVDMRANLRSKCFVDSFQFVKCCLPSC